MRYVYEPGRQSRPSLKPESLGQSVTIPHLIIPRRVTGRRIYDSAAAHLDDVFDNFAEIRGQGFTHAKHGVEGMDFVCRFRHGTFTVFCQPPLATPL